MDNHSISFTDQLRHFLLGLDTSTKRFVGVAVDLVLIPVALWLAFFVRLGPSQLISPIDYYWLFLAAIGITVPVFVKFGLYRAVLRYMGRDAITTIIKAVSISALLLALTIYWVRSDLLIPRTLVFNFWILSFALVGGARFLARAFLLPDKKDRRFSALITPHSVSDTRRKVAIYGAGAAGFQLYRSILDDKDIRPVAFIDDNPSLQGRSIGGLRVYAREDMPLLIQKTGTREVFLAIPSLGAAARQGILQFLEAYPVHVRTVPSVYELTTGRKEVGELQEVRIEDILGRDVVEPELQLLEPCIQGKTVMVTGAGGSIGSELCRQIIELNPAGLVLFEHSEFNLFTIEQELRTLLERRDLDLPLYGILGSILNLDQLRTTMSSFNVDTIYHAAAYKHVPIVEQNIAAGVRNNVFGTLFTAQAAIETKVEKFVLVSTDKAVRPTNIMGASKRLAELVLQGLSAETSPVFPGFSGEDQIVLNNRTRFTSVRFGNVLGSSGSVIPTFRSQIRNGGPVTVTHPDVTRYFMTITEAAQLVIQASSMGTGGDVFVLDMGESVSILDLALKMIRLSGLIPKTADSPNGDVEIQFIGLRAGEKLYEELLIGNNTFPTGHSKICRAQESSLTWAEVVDILTLITEALELGQTDVARNLLAKHVDGYTPHTEIVDWSHQSAIGVAADDVKNVVALKPKT